MVERELVGRKDLAAVDAPIPVASEDLFTLQ
jgi:hypothetical protein